MNFFKINSDNNKLILIYTIFLTCIWYLIFGIDQTNEPYIWDDLHFFREYTPVELKNIWVGNWDPDEIETPSYRPIAILYYHFLYLIFEENTFLLRHFIIVESLILILLSSLLLNKLNFNKNSIFVFISLIIFSKIFITLVSWFTISVLTFAYIFTISSILFFLNNKNNLFYFLSIIFSTIAIFIREELYVLPIVLFLIYFYKYEINAKNFFNCLIKVFPFVLIVLLHMALRKEFVPEADHLNFTMLSIKYGENFLSLGGLIKALKSSFLPMGYLSSSYSTRFQSVLAWIWIILIFFFITILFFKTQNSEKKFKKIFILFFIIFTCCLPHLTVARSFGIYLSSLFGLALISNLISAIIPFIIKKNEKLNFLYSFLIIAIVLSGIVGGIYRSIEHAKSMSQYSISVIKLDALFIYGYKNANINVTIPQERYLSKEQHLKKLGIYDYHWGDEINKKSSKIIKNHYDLLSF